MKKTAVPVAMFLLGLSLSGCSLVASQPLSPQASPGTASRPVLSTGEAGHFTQERYFAHKGKLSAPEQDLWQPQPIGIAAVKADYTVGTGGAYATVQQAVNAAITSGKRSRQYIRIEPGTYTGAVYVPIDAGPLTLYGSGRPEDVNIELTLDARTPPSAYIAAVNPAGQFKAGDPAWNMYKVCAGQTADKPMDTPCAAVMWAQADGFQLKNLTVTNTLLESVIDAKREGHQAVALRSDGDRAQFENVRLIGRQDTFLVNVGEAPTPTNKVGTYPLDKIARAYIRDSYIEGDVDFVFGRANAVFDNCEFRAVSTRRSVPAIVFAPDSVPASSLGFLVMNSRITGDKGHQELKFSKLGRSWDQGAGATGYLPGSSPNGQLVIRDSYIDASFDLAAPWDKAATTGRPHRGNIAPERKFDDPAFNRLWEFNNYGPGAGPAR
ncbi:putative acyl-CoA thioester hydrolase [Uliginosibacterium sp. 31-16]|uniref:putative acyl-CoA thioester hydrolase n=1 Tax=Uliginosibacterium sp. 31-16 TaxID=3068315 RepID=UPI00273DF9D9|nr:putative acyl-CoA thioester hydrolase [Uliginosibacterium sp. 31-16]MDP5238779.1 putative acyl-CoA thioester hydrolase [Uliginosibacterium sp. 31-16]